MYEDRSVIVTGAGRGIGRATALALARAGARVALVARTASEIEAVADAIRQAGGQATTVACDLLAQDSPDRIVQAALEAFGGLDALVNNAGIGLRATVAETRDEDWNAVLGLNLTSVFRLTRAALPHLAERRGHVVMVSSLAASSPTPGMAAYGASKAALDHFASSLMLEVRHTGVRVTVVAPGSCATTFGGTSGEQDWRLCPDDVGAAILHCLQARPDAITSRVDLRPLRPPGRS